ncbi:cation:proton antiporter [Geomonas subterranea]|uniref:Cation:proton antiporter n=1 Tax=Geomonas subterranea TaxID=2847989 RepID=A0ABX8LLU8_9BACT|nr:cation:proton antiporter [Geomonas subterranea]QXE91891.1 cation:proton antiporter [Geomonas subterranea]QXM10017.1 cation:proton antiporter [Geomonas subterranea]
MHDLSLIMTVTGGFVAALCFGYLAHRIGLSSIVGFLLAGIAVGPYTPGFVADRHMAEQFAEIGVILLMFGVGLQFHFKELLQVKRAAVPGALGQSAVATLLSAVVAVGMGWSWPAGIIFGLAVSVASTVVLLRVLVDNNELHTPAGHIAVGWLVVEDLLTVFLLVILPVLFGPQATSGGNLPAAIGLALLKIGLLIVVTFWGGGKVIPRILEHVAETHSRELFTLTVLVLALGIAVASAKFFGVSMALGAFLAGMVVKQSDFSFRAATEALPMRDAFAVLFFVSVGMLFDPAHLMQQPGLVLIVLAIIVIGKPLAAVAIMLGLGYAPRVALSVALALAQIGEFSFILASVGRDLGVLEKSGANTLVAAAIISISLNPLLYRCIPFFERQAKGTRLWQWLEARSRPDYTGAHADGTTSSSSDRAIVVGYGPTGKTLARLLTENGIEPFVVEMNLHTVRQLQQEGIGALYGDANLRETLEAAGLEQAVALVLTSAGMQGEEEVIRLARQLNPQLRILARTSYLRDMPTLYRAGANAVFSGEGEIALNMTEHMLRGLGATDEQIDRQRDRVRAELATIGQ